MIAIGQRFSGSKILLISVVAVFAASGCGGGTSSGVSVNDGNIFDADCRISDPGFPFCGGDWLRCRNQDQTLYQVYKSSCPSGWTVVPDEVMFPGLACTNPDGQTFNVDADQCPPGWTPFTINF